MGNPVVFGDSKILFYFDMTDWPQFCKFEEPSGRHVNFAKLRPLKKKMGSSMYYTQYPIIRNGDQR